VLARKARLTNMINCRVDLDLRRELERRAIEQDCTLSWLIEHYIRIGMRLEGALTRPLFPGEQVSITNQVRRS
jgi:hypothetical protein